MSTTRMMPMLYLHKKEAVLEVQLQKVRIAKTLVRRKSILYAPTVLLWGGKGQPPPVGILLLFLLIGSMPSFIIDVMKSLGGIRDPLGAKGPQQLSTTLMRSSRIVVLILLIMFIIIKYDSPYANDVLNERERALIFDALRSEYSNMSNEFYFLYTKLDQIKYHLDRCEKNLSQKKDACSFFKKLPQVLDSYIGDFAEGPVLKGISKSV